jgi:hypothetical protein
MIIDEARLVCYLKIQYSTFDPFNSPPISHLKETIDEFRLKVRKMEHRCACLGILRPEFLQLLRWEGIELLVDKATYWLRIE